MIDYSNLNKILLLVRAESCAAECHGFLCGQICVSGIIDESLAREFLDIRIDDDHLECECYRQIQLLGDDILFNIESEEFDFELLLPSDECPLEERVAALGAWCYGFLYGFGVADANNQGSLSRECRDMLEDFSQISQVDTVDECDEDAEMALLELIEYVRIATMVIFEELHPEIYRNNESGVLH